MSPQPWENRPVERDSGGKFHAPIPANGDRTLDPIPRSIFVGGAGDLIVRDRAGTVATYKVLAGTYVSIEAVTILAATTATSLVAVW